MINRPSEKNNGIQVEVHVYSQSAKMTLKGK